MSRERSAIKELKKSLEEIRGTAKGFRSDGRDLLGSIRAQPLRGALERRGPLRRFLETRPTPFKELLDKRKSK